MKKLFVLLLAAVLCACACWTAFADMGGPEFIGYKAKTKAETEYFDQEWNEETDESVFKKAGTIPAGTELEISNEYDFDGVMYGYFFDAPSLGGASGYVRVQDLSVDGREDYPAVSAYTQSLHLRLRVTDPKGLPLYAGPSGSYTPIGVIPQNAEVTVEATNQEGYDVSAWMYMTYGGMRGWAYCWLYDGAKCTAAELLPEGETGTVWVVRDNAVLTDRDGNELVTVPKGEKLTFDSFNRMPHDYTFYVTYQGKSGSFTVNDDGYDNVVAAEPYGGVVYDPPVQKDASVSVYAYPDDKTPLGTVRYQAGDVLESTYKFYADPLEEYRGGVEWVHVDKDGQSGWIKLSDLPLEYPENYDEYAFDIPVLYTSESTKTDVTAQPPAEGESESQTQAGEEADVSPAPDAALTTTGAPASGRSLSPAGIIGVCIAAAAVLALTAFVTLRLIRRKKGD